MSSVGARPRRVARCVVAVLTAWLGLIVSPGSAVGVPLLSTASHAYDAPNTTRHRRRRPPPSVTHQPSTPLSFRSTPSTEGRVTPRRAATPPRVTAPPPVRGSAQSTAPGPRQGRGQRTPRGALSSSRGGVLPQSTATMPLTSRQRRVVATSLTATGYGGEAGNTWFPRGWSDDKIMHSLSDIATDPSLTWVQQTGRAAAAYTRGGAPVRYTVEGVRDGVKIRVVLGSCSRWRPHRSRRPS